MMLLLLLLLLLLSLLERSSQEMLDSLTNTRPGPATCDGSLTFYPAESLAERSLTLTSSNLQLGVRLRLRQSGAWSPRPVCCYASSLRPLTTSSRYPTTHFLP